MRNQISVPLIRANLRYFSGFVNGLPLSVNFLQSYNLPMYHVIIYVC